MDGPRSTIVLCLKRNDFLWKKAQSLFLGILRCAAQILSRQKPKMLQDTSADLCILRN
jgi:hypothetical protein